MPLIHYIENFHLYIEARQFILYTEKETAYSKYKKVLSISDLAIAHYMYYIPACGAEIKHVPEQLRKEPEINNDNY